VFWLIEAKTKDTPTRKAEEANARSLRLLKEARARKEKGK
jgi:hypothetical protein